MHAYIIEDDYLIGQTIQDILGDLGFTRFSFARSEDVAIMGAGEQKFDLITADARLLPGDGISAVEAICARRDAPVVLRRVPRPAWAEARYCGFAVWAGGGCPPPRPCGA